MKKLLASLLLCLVATSAYADTCAARLVGSFTAAQATTLCTKFGTSAPVSIIPQVDNSIDLGSASLTFRTLYTGTSRIAKTSDILRVRQDAQRLFTWDASSDTALTQTFGDGTASQTFFITGTTADAADTQVACITGGGLCANNTRGSSFYAEGADVGGANNGDIQIASTDDTFFYVGSGTTLALTIDQAGVMTKATANDFNFNVGLATIGFQEAVAGSACSGTLTANGATPVVISTTCATTGSRIFTSRTSAETGTVNAWVSAISNGVSFSVTSEAADTGTYNWVIFHEAP